MSECTTRPVRGPVRDLWGQSKTQDLICQFGWANVRGAYTAMLPTHTWSSTAGHMFAMHPADGTPGLALHQRFAKAATEMSTCCAMGWCYWCPRREMTTVAEGGKPSKERHSAAECSKYDGPGGPRVWLDLRKELEAAQLGREKAEQALEKVRSDAKEEGKQFSQRTDQVAKGLREKKTHRDEVKEKVGNAKEESEKRAAAAEQRAAVLAEKVKELKAKLEKAAHPDAAAAAAAADSWRRHELVIRPPRAGVVVLTDIVCACWTAAEPDRDVEKTR
eukprot:gene28661-57542_t